jgi:hypothetical protein
VKLAANIGLQIAMQTTLVVHNSGLREAVGLRQLRILAQKAEVVAKAFQDLSRKVVYDFAKAVKARWIGAMMWFGG